ncbi:MAG: class I SAM-dependent methyltransferase [Luteimonas sp.]
MSFECKICESSTEGMGEQLVLGKHLAEYRRCRRCGYVSVVDPHWLEEAYSIAITALDTGIVERNLWLADATCALLRWSFPEVRTAIDYGGGTGLLARLMRDRGHDFHWHDAYSPNLLARGFDAGQDEAFDLLTAFELIEHLPDPWPVLEQFRKRAPRWLLSTELLPEAPRLEQWWYFAPETGQHIGFFSRAALEVVAERVRMRLSSNDRNLHVLSERAVDERFLRMLRKPARARWIGWTGRGRSLAHADAADLRKRLQQR